MQSLPKLYLPDDFTGLLKSNFNASSDFSGLLTNYLSRRPAFRKLIEDKFQEFDPMQRRAEFVVQTLGWANFRDRLASLYLEHLNYNRFPAKTNISLVADVSQLEDKLSKYTVEGYSRSFLLGYYFKMARAYMNKIDSEQEYADLEIDGETLKLLNKIQTKIVSIDWLILVLIHFRNFLGKDRLVEHIEQEKFNYFSLYNELEAPQKIRMLKNMLVYGQAINEIDMFVDLTV